MRKQVRDSRREAENKGKLERVRGSERKTKRQNGTGKQTGESQAPK